MIKTIIKRNGSREEFSAEKLNGWSEWAASNLGRNVNWSEVVLHAVSTLPQTCSSKELQECLIQYCLGKNTWEYNLMAGRLYAALLIRLVHKSDTYPTVKEVQDKLVKAKLMRKLNYTDEDYEKIEKIINHNLNMKYPHYALHQNRKKYSLQNKTTGTEYETSQHLYMRMAMAAAENEPLERRIQEVKEYYDEFANHRLNVPTPYYVNLGTNLSGYASCCVYTTKDTAKSLAAADHIAYMMTVMSAGIGYHLKSRSIGDPVRGGSIEHQGKIPYARSYVGALGANLQNGRGGAGTLYYNAFDPEVETIVKLKNPITPLTKQVRGSDYSFGSNRLVVRACARNEDIALFSYYHAPELYEAIYSGDQDYFEKLYAEFLASDLPRRMISARKVVLNALTEAFETGRHYEHFTDHLNAHTPFYDKIYSGNLCVTGDTTIEFCDEDGNEYKDTIKNFCEKYDENSRYYAKSYDTETNKICFSLITDAGPTANTDSLYIVTDSEGNVLKCTPDHKVYTFNRGFVTSKELNNDDVLVLDNGKTSKVVEVKIDIVDELVYDIKVVKTECFFANGILVHNCVEIALPTAGFNSTEELYQDYKEDLNFIEFKDQNRKKYHLYSWDRINTNRGHILSKDLRLEDIISDESVSKDTIQVTKIVERSIAPEIAICNIGGIIVSNIKNDEEYKKTAYRVLKLIRYGILNSTYVFKNLEKTSAARMNAGVGIVGLAHLMAKKGLSYESQDGLNFMHELAETHYWHLANASLELSKEYGVAEWMYKTKWPEGWTPLSTYNKNVDSLVTVENKRDWDGFSKKVIENGGIMNSVLVAHMPAESSSISGGTTNGLYPIRKLYLNKTNETLSLSYVVPDSTRLKAKYEFANDIKTESMIKVYAVFQKWTDQAISADLWRKVQGTEKVSTTEMLSGYFMRHKFGVKQRYYQNSETAKGIDLNAAEQYATIEEEMNDDVGCGSGGCSL